jgi:hypothetical protein
MVPTTYAQRVYHLLQTLRVAQAAKGHAGRCLEPQFFLFHLPQRTKTQASTTANNPNRSEVSRTKAMKTSPKATKTMAGRVAKGS